MQFSSQLACRDRHSTVVPSTLLLGSTLAGWMVTHRLQDLHGARLHDVVRKVLGEGLAGRETGGWAGCEGVMYDMR